MTKDDLLNQYIINYPNPFFKMLSFRFPFTKEQVIKFQDVLGFGSYGIQFNPHVNFDDDLRHIAGKRMMTMNSSYIFEKYSSIQEYNENWSKRKAIYPIEKFTLYQNTDEHRDLFKGRKYFDVSDIDFKYLKKHELALNSWHWKIIYANYTHKIDYEILTQLSSKFNKHTILLHPNVDWLDARVFNLLATSWEICKLWLPFEIAIKPLISEDFILEVIDFLSANLPRKVKITWNGGNNKYLISIYVSGKADDLCITGGYFYTNKPVLNRNEIILSPNIKILKNNNTLIFKIDNIIVNPFEISTI